jgi:KaiC/GvpD/RAD55 family RecA-like ATPase
MTETEGVRRCDYCRLPCLEETVTIRHRGVTYTFCSSACRSALEGNDRVFTEYHGFRQFSPGVTVLDAALPEGIPRNSLVLLSNRPGTREGALRTELAWRTLQRGEPAVVVSFLEPPISVLQGFVSLGWNPIPHLEAGRLSILDCFTYRVDDRDRMAGRMDDWNTHLQAAAEPATRTVGKPADISRVLDSLERSLAGQGVNDTGVVVVDSLTELGVLAQPGQAHDLLKDMRATICKGQFVPVFTGAAVGDTAEGFPHDLEYLVDGIVDMGLNPDLVEDQLVKELRVRKMGGVPVRSQWTAYDFAEGTGLVPLDIAGCTEEGDPDDDPGGDESANS